MSFKETPSNPESKEQYNEIGEHYSSGAAEFLEEGLDDGRKFIYSELGEIKGKSILDIGCGPGLDLKNFENAGAKVFGVDPSSEMITQAKDNVANPERVVLGNYLKIPFPDEKFDFIVGRFSLHYLDAGEIDKAYKELARVLKENGKLILVVSHPEADIKEGNVFLKEGKKWVKTSLYQDKVIIQYPLHEMDEYFSPEFNKLFEKTNKLEYKGSERDSDLEINALAFSAIKK